MNKEKFKIIQYIRELIVYIDKSMDNFPKKDIEIKNRIRTNSFDLLEMAYETNIIEDVKLKKSMLLKCIAKIKIIDFLLNLSYDKQIINEKKYLKFAAKLDDIAKFMNGWLKSMGSKESNNVSTNKM